MSGVNRQGQAHIVSTAIQSPRSGKGVEATPSFRTWFSIDPQPASISPTINISIVFICAFLVDCGRTIRQPPVKNDSAILRSVTTADRMAARRKLDQRRDDLCAVALRNRASFGASETRISIASAIQANAAKARIR